MLHLPYKERNSMPFLILPVDLIQKSMNNLVWACVDPPLHGITRHRKALLDTQTYK